MDHLPGKSLTYPSFDELAQLMIPYLEDIEYLQRFHDQQKFQQVSFYYFPGINICLWIG